MVYGAEVLAIRGNFDRTLDIVREAAEKYPVTLVNSVNLTGYGDRKRRPSKSWMPSEMHPTGCVFPWATRKHHRLLDGFSGYQQAGQARACLE